VGLLSSRSTRTNIFNDGAFDAVKEHPENQIRLEHAQPIRFGEDGERGVRQRADGSCELVDVAEVGEDALLVHDEHHDTSSLAFALSRIAHTPQGPAPFGVFRDIERPVYDELMAEQIERAKEKRGVGDLRELLHAGDTWTIS
jgi:2-oxoglutarate ferredoxin oxidoreductase subunit beta